MTRRPTILDELGRELVRAAREEEARAARGASGGRLPRAVVVALLAVLGFTAAAVAAKLIIGRGAPFSVARAADVPVELRPVAGSARLSGLDVPDPDGGPAWDVRTSRSKTGAVCATVGQVHDGELGLLGLDRRFRALPAGAADTCSRRQASGVTLAGARAFRGAGRLSDLTVISGVAAASVRSVAAVAGERAVPVRMGANSAFLAVLRGRPEGLRPRIVLTETSGKRTVLRFADSGRFLVSDPSGDAPWTLNYSRGRNGLRCVRAFRGLGEQARNVASVPRRCGRPGATFVAIQRFVPRLEDFDQQPTRSGAMPIPPFLWRLFPSRTVVWGSVPRAGSAVVLTGAGAPRRLPVDASRGRARRLRGAGGGFVAVLDGRVDPRRLRVTVDGRLLDPRKTFGPGGRRTGNEPVPAWRSVQSVRRRMPRFDEPYVVVPGSVSISRRAGDPAGGPAWALRSWSARRAPGTPSPGAETDLVCFAVGAEQGGGRLAEPLPNGVQRTVGTGIRDARCAGAGELASGSTFPDVRSYVDDGAAPDPRPVRVVVAGLLGDRAGSAELLGAGAPRVLELGRHGTFLVVLGPEHAGANLRVRERRAGGPTRILGGLPADHPAMTLTCVPTPGMSIRVADPDGGPSWTAARGRARGRGCSYVGRLVGDRVATLYDGNQVHFGPSQSSFPLRDRQPPADRPLKLTVTDPRSSSFSWFDEGDTPTGAQVARRTLPGRTLVTGRANDGVLSITLRTPRDVRTIRPGPGGLILAVYDGPFYSGQLHATAHMRDGRTITQTKRIGYL